MRTAAQEGTWQRVQVVLQSGGQGDWGPRNRGERGYASGCLSSPHTGALCWPG